VNTLYQVVYTGQLKPGVDSEQATQDFAAIFKTPVDRARTLICGQVEHVLKKEIDVTNAEHYRELLDEIGLEVYVEPMHSGESASAMPLAKSSDEKPGTVPAQANGPAAASPGREGDRDAYRSSDAGTAGIDPYAPPSADLYVPLAQSEGDEIMSGPHAMAMGHGWQWISEAFNLFKDAPLTWILIFISMMIINILISAIPMVGQLINLVIAPILYGGLMLGAHAQARGGRLQISHLFAGFSSHLGPLLIIGLLYLSAVIVAGLLTGVLTMGLAVSMSGLDPNAFDPDAMQAEDLELMLSTLGPAVLIAALFFLLIMLPVIMAYWFSPALVVLGKVQPLEAVKLSFIACLRNILPFLIYGFAALALIILGIIPFFLGLLIVIPILIASSYTSFRDVFYQH
jgi:hypothetical protein